MLTNATITHLRRPSGHTASGQAKLGNPIAQAVRCFTDAISSRQRYMLGATIADADQTLYVSRSALARWSQDLINGDIITLVLDSGEVAMIKMLTGTNHITPGTGRLSHVELFARRLKPEEVPQ